MLELTESDWCSEKWGGLSLWIGGKVSDKILQGFIIYLSILMLFEWLALFGSFHVSGTVLGT